MAKVHPLLEALLKRFKSGDITQEEHEAERLRILQDEIGVGVALVVAPAPTAPKASFTVSAKDRAAEDKRIQDSVLAARRDGRVYNAIPKVEVRPARTAISVMTTENGELVRKILSPEAVKAAVAVASGVAAAANRPSASLDGPTVAILPGFMVSGGVIKPRDSGKSEPDQIVEAVRLRWKSGEFGPPGKPCGRAPNVLGKQGGCLGESCSQCSPAIKASRAEIIRLRADKPITVCRIVCSICNGRYDSKRDRGTALEGIGKQCLCEGRGFLTVDTSNAQKRADRGAFCADPLPVDAESVTYTAWLKSGGCTTVHADSGQKAVRGACSSLRQAGNGYERVVLDSGLMLVLSLAQTHCAACYGTALANGKTCVQCAVRGVATGKITKIGMRFYFGDECSACRGQKYTIKKDNNGGQEAKPCNVCNETGRNPTPAAERAHEAGLAAMTPYDTARQCGREKCKGMHPLQIQGVEQHRLAAASFKDGGCYACRDAAMGGYQRAGYIRCSECQGTGKLKGEDHDRCRGKGYFNTTEYYWISDTNSFKITNQIRRAEVLAEDQIPKMDRNLMIYIGEDEIEVGAGAVPSRRSGSVLHKTGTARQKYDTAEAVYGNQEIVKGKGGKTGWSNRPSQGAGFLTSVHNDKSTFSDG